MPKVLSNVREDVLNRARKTLFSQGYQALGMRQIAADCGISVGTLYNYFENKDTLVACIMLEDWKEHMEKALKDTQHVSSLMDGLQIIYDNMEAFIKTYQWIWSEYATENKGSIVRVNYHDLLVQQIREIVKKLLCKFSMNQLKNLDIVLAETLVSMVRNEEIHFEDFRESFQKAFQ